MRDLEATSVQVLDAHDDATKTTNGHQVTVVQPTVIFDRALNESPRSQICSPKHNELGAFTHAPIVRRSPSALTSTSGFHKQSRVKNWLRSSHP